MLCCWATVGVAALALAPLATAAAAVVGSVDVIPNCVDQSPTGYCVHVSSFFTNSRGFSRSCFHCFKCLQIESAASGSLFRR